MRPRLKLLLILSLGLLFWHCEPNNKKSEDLKRIDQNDLSENKITDIVSGYILLKDAFISSESESARSAAIEFKKVVSGNVDAAFEKALLSVTDKIIQSEDIEEQRVIFEQISVLMYALAQNGQFEGYTLYKQYCPMAFNNKGAYWLSLEENILNPYFGEKMLKCGTVEEIL